MAIYKPGLRYQDSKSRDAMVILSLTAMADMFTVLVIFLLQNLFATGEALDLYTDVKLPEAREIKELKPANVIVVSKTYLMLNSDVIEEFESIRNDPQVWMIEPLKEKIEALIVEERQKRESLPKKLKEEIYKKEVVQKDEENPKELRITVQSDQEVEFSVLKKIMYTITQAGVREINFAVIPKKKESGT